MIPAALGVPTAFLYLTTQDYTLIVIGFALQGMFACGGMHVQYPAYLSARFPTEVRAAAVAFCFHQGAIWGGLISPLLILYASTQNVALSGPILVTTVDRHRRLDTHCAMVGRRDKKRSVSFSLDGCYGDKLPCGNRIAALYFLTRPSQEA